MDANSERDPIPEDMMIPSEMKSLETGPMGPLVTAVYDKQPILVALRSNRKLYGFVKAVDRHWNMILEHCIEISQEPSRPSAPTPTPKRRQINRLFLRGDNVVCVFPNPTPPSKEN